MAPAHPSNMAKPAQHSKEIEDLRMLAQDGDTVEVTITTVQKFELCEDTDELLHEAAIGMSVGQSTDVTFEDDERGTFRMVVNSIERPCDDDLGYGAPFRAARHRDRSPDGWLTHEMAIADGFARWPDNFLTLGGVVNSDGRAILHAPFDGFDLAHIINPTPGQLLVPVEVGRGAMIAQEGDTVCVRISGEGDMPPADVEFVMGSDDHPELEVLARNQNVGFGVTSEATHEGEVPGATVLILSIERPSPDGVVPGMIEQLVVEDPPSEEPSGASPEGGTEPAAEGTPPDAG